MRACFNLKDKLANAYLYFKHVISCNFIRLNGKLLDAIRLLLHLHRVKDGALN